MDYFKDIPTLLRALRTIQPQGFGFHIHRHEDTPESHLEETSLFRSDAYAILLLTEGTADYKIGLSSYQMRPGALYFMGPPHLRYYKKTAPWRGYVLLFMDTFLLQTGSTPAPSSYPFFQIDANVLLQLSPEEYAPFEALLQQMHDIYHQPTPDKSALLFHYLSIFLLRAKRRYLAQQPTINDQPEHRQVTWVKAFERELELHFYELAKQQTNRVWSVADFAARLHLSPHHLSEVVKQQLGKTPAQLIKERTALEACSLLRNTNWSISEVAYFLHFNDASNFAKFFKKMIGQTPKSYRNSDKNS
ncbi:MAG: helix-turn-helix transcriptional regulator [Bacteroidota bacterium]